MKNTITLSELANKREIFIDYSAVFNTHFVNPSYPTTLLLL